MNFDKELFVKIAKSLLKTNYVLHSYAPNVGLDCATFIHYCLLYSSFDEAIDFPVLNADFGLHKKDDTYLNKMEDYFTQVKEPLKGDLILLKYGKSFNHAGILLDNGNFIHCCAGKGVIISSIDTTREQKYYRIEV